MSIDPDNINTVQVKDLPPNELSLTDNFPHEVGDVLSRSTIQDLANFLRSQSVSYPYEIKYIYPPNYAYIEDNFDMTPGSAQGIGKISGIWNGWAIFNGNNGTANLDGRTLIGFGANYATTGQMLGEEEHVLTIPELPVVSPINGTFFKKGSSFGGSTGLTVGDVGTTNFAPGELVKPFGGGLAHNNIQPSMVVLIIMKLP